MTAGKEGGRSGASLRPRSNGEGTRVLPNVELSENAYEVANGADALVIATEWADFRDLDWERVHATMARPLVLDGRNLLQVEVMKSFGFEYDSFGRPDLAQEMVRSVA